MFARSLTRSSVSLRAARYARPAFVSTPYTVSKNYYSSFDKKTTAEKEAMRKNLIIESQLNLDPKIENVKIPQGLSTALNRILMPLLHFAHQENSLDKARDQLQQLSETMKDPISEELFLNDWVSKPDSLGLIPVVRAVVEQLDETKDLKQIPEVFEAFSYVYRQLANERTVRVILPSKPSAAEEELLENELKAFYYKDPSVKLTLQVSVNEDIGSGRIYCFDDTMLDLTTTNFTQELKAAMNQPRNDYLDTVKELKDLIKRPLNYDLKPSNKIYKEQLANYQNKVMTACGFVAS